MTEIQQYKLALRRVRTYQRKLSQKREAFQPVTNEESILTGIIDSLTYSIEYLETGREPGTRRGAHRRSREQREVPFDPDWINRRRIPIIQEEPVSEETRELLEDVLNTLSYYERQTFELVRGQGFSYGEAAKLLKVSKGTVQNLVDRAESKLLIAVGRERPIQRVLLF